MFQNKFIFIYCIFVFVAVVLAAPRQDQKFAPSLTKRAECEFGQKTCGNKCCIGKETCTKDYSGKDVCDPGA
ncbi:unnamed protein product [Cunninghamella echinulata]